MNLSLNGKIERVQVSVFFSEVIVGGDGDGSEMAERWCDAVEAYIDYDNDPEDLRGI